MVRRFSLAICAVFQSFCILDAATILSADEDRPGGVNLLFNPEMSMTDGMGEIAGWSRDNNSGWCKIDGRHSNLPTVTVKHGEIELSFSDQNLRVIRQKYFHLASGGKFRLAAEVRTSGLNGGRIHFELTTDKDSGSIMKIDVPQSTSGEWQKVEETFTTPIEWTGGLPQNKGERHFIFQIAGAAQRKNRVAQLGIRRLMLEPLDETARSGSHPINPDYVAPMPRRIVPIEPLLSKVEAENAEMLFYWPGEPECGVSACVLSAKIDGIGASVRSSFAADGRTRLKFGRLSPGDHNVTLAVEDTAGRHLATNSYLFTAIAPKPEGPCGQRLNNFVTRLHDADLSNGNVRFFVPADGWIWMSVTGASENEAVGTLDDASAPCVQRRKGERFNEGQRFLPTGWHTLRIAGADKGGRLRIHAVKTLATNPPVLKEEPSSFEPRLSLTLPFHRHFGTLSTFNVLNGLTSGSSFRGEFEKRGLRFWGPTPGAGVWSAVRFNGEELASRVESADWKAGMDVIVDENPVDVASEWGTPLVRRNSFLYSEIVWDMRARRPHGGAVNTYYSDSNYGARFRDRKCHASEISSIINSGDGHGFVVPEAYAPTFADESLSALWEGYFAGFLRSAVDFVPAARGRVLFWLAPYVDLGGWTSYDSPEVDLKAHYARLIRLFAVAPEFADIGGIGFGAASSANDDIRRWGYRLVRHYCLEGATDDIAAQYGFKWTPGFVKNCDFADGLTAWTPVLGDEGRIVAETITGYGRRQGRQNLAFPSVRGLGDGVAVFISGTSPNRLEQKLSGLVPGKYYTLEYSVADYDGAVKGRVGKKLPPTRFSACLWGATEVRPLAYRHACAPDKIGMTSFRHVFRADGPEYTLIISDCDAEGRLSTKGTKQVVNHIVFKPYYLESTNEIHEITALFTDLRGLL